MTSPAPFSGDETRDEHLFTLLDDYVQRLNRGEQPSREALLRDNPELLPVLDCLDALDSLAPLTAQPAVDAEGLAFTAAWPRANDQSPEPRVDTASSAPPVAVGTEEEFAGFELLEEIGRGGMGVVYRARQKSLDRVVALKMILTSQADVADRVARFQEEAKAAASLQHPNIVRVFEVGRSRGLDFFAMDYIAGESLAKRLADCRRRPLTDEMIARLLLDVARAVEYLHQHQLLHRDLKPSNILLDEAGRPFVTDFGLAKLFSANARADSLSAIVGTPSYMAPEQASGDLDRVGPRSDVYSLGAILFEMLAGRPPFQEQNPLDTLLQVIEREPPLPRTLRPEVSPALERICLRCLEKSPGDRYQSAAALADDLEKFLVGEPLSVQAPGLGQRLRRWVWREPGLAARLATLTLFYAAETASFLLSGGANVTAHLLVTGFGLAWGAGSFLCQRWLRSAEWARAAPVAWISLDACVLMAILLTRGGMTSHLGVGFPLLIVLSALWCERRLVWLATVEAMLGYCLLMVDFYFWRTELQESADASLIRHAFYLVMLLVISATMQHLVARMRALIRYAESMTRW